MSLLQVYVWRLASRALFAVTFVFGSFSPVRSARTRCFCFFFSIFGVEEYSDGLVRVGETPTFQRHALLWSTIRSIRDFVSSLYCFMGASKPHSSCPGVHPFLVSSPSSKQVAAHTLYSWGSLFCVQLSVYSSRAGKSDSDCLWLLSAFPPKKVYDSSCMKSVNSVYVRNSLQLEMLRFAVDATCTHSFI